MNLCPTCRKFIYRTDACKGVGVECGRTDGGSKKSTVVAKARHSDLLEGQNRGEDRGDPKPVQIRPVDIDAGSKPVPSSVERAGIKTEDSHREPIALTKRGTPRRRAPKGTFDRKAYQRDAARQRRQRLKEGKTE